MRRDFGDACCQAVQTFLPYRALLKCFWIKNTVLWNKTPYISVARNQPFGRKCCV